jgi:hypothetical protein
MLDGGEQAPARNLKRKLGVDARGVRSRITFDRIEIFLVGINCPESQSPTSSEALSSCTVCGKTKRLLISIDCVKLLSEVF